MLIFLSISLSLFFLSSYQEFGSLKIKMYWCYNYIVIINIYLKQLAVILKDYKLSYISDKIYRKYFKWYYYVDYLQCILQNKKTNKIHNRYRKPYQRSQ